ncbi:hypothetical protein BDF20DRAFT_901891 [Mycotypha africana]|uniref:uncharacterized protein n=1 Tax=Mycotypha africana TaxID=64632 RepID=UPI0023018DCE|nr:uncharacterized protein BDF20DRAFT_901891 [Mycotypha africana]KAI8967138.1 hypothetical protein BDF20DRAFT_901891 [Mycotypha africana]
MSTTTPFSGWLQKLTTKNTFVASRWQSRLFVLLDTELRYYKDEHAATASKTIDLREVARVKTITHPHHQHLYCFRLEPLTKKQKAWTIACKSKEELDAWVSAIHLRLASSSTTTPTKPQLQQQHVMREKEMLLSPTEQPFSTPEQNRQPPPLSLMSTLHTDHENTDTAAPASRPRVVKRKKSKACLSRRRGVILSPLDIEAIPGLLDASETSYDSSSSSTSAMDELHSRDTDLCYAIEINLSPSSVVSKDDQSILEGQLEEANKAVPQNAYLLNMSSPSFAIYKERFHI